MSLILVRTLRRLALLLALVHLTIACGGADDDSDETAAGGDASSAAGETVTIRMARINAVTEWAHEIADAKGYFEDNGIVIDAIEASTVPGTQALLAGDVDIVPGLSSAITLYGQEGGDGPSDLIDVGDVVDRAPYSLVVSDDIDDFADLEGTSLGISGPTDGAGVMLRNLLVVNGLELDSVDLIPTGNTPDRLSALESGAIEGTVLVPPASLLAVESGFEELAWLPQAMGDDWATLFYNFTVKRAWAEENRDALTRFLKAQDQGLQFLADPANRKEAIDILAEAQDMSPEHGEAIYELMVGGDTPVFRDRIGVDLDSIQGNLDELEAMGELEESPDPADFADESFAQEARGE